MLWHPDLGAIPRWASSATVALALREREANLDALGPAQRQLARGRRGTEA